MKHVTKHERPGVKKPWRVRINRRGKMIHGGYYATEAEAGEAALALEAKLDGVTSSEGKYVHMFNAVIPLTVISRSPKLEDTPALRRYVATMLRIRANTPEAVTLKKYVS